jgi:hypothetical protein
LFSRRNNADFGTLLKYLNEKLPTSEQATSRMFKGAKNFHDEKHFVALQNNSSH